MKKPSVSPERKASLLAALGAISINTAPVIARPKSTKPTSPPPPRIPLLDPDLDLFGEASSPKRRKSSRFLPGESRANCGPDGFRDLNHQEYFSRLSFLSSLRESPVRNLTPPQHLDERGRIISGREREVTFGLGAFPADSFPCQDLTNRKGLLASVNTLHYINSFLLNLTLAEYPRGETFRFSPLSITIRASHPCASCEILGCYACPHLADSVERPHKHIPYQLTLRSH